MERRQFLISTAAAFGAELLTLRVRSQLRNSTDPGARVYHVLGVPLRAGSLLPGNENDGQAYREAGLVAQLEASGCKAVDDGDVVIPSFLPHHSVPPIRSWPAPRIAWEAVRDRVAPLLKEPGQVPLLVGCDCSIVVGTAEALMRAAGGNVHVVYVDGDFDDAPPEATRSQSAASCAVWLLTHDSPFWAGPPLKPSQVSVVGWTVPSRSNSPRISSISLAEIHRNGAREAAGKVLESIPASAAILLHFDTDVVRKGDLPSAYFPHAKGLTMAETTELLHAILRDPRIRLIEVSEYAALRDLDGAYVKQLIQLLATGLKA